ncbi:copper amine oxidase N-terminal domain-containing protein [Clostridium sp. SM-530-WT-3G]|uniref:N-acetylmuramoyl-L-alanine amidase family protein n=1 Tax=Clostridium sp. SM-530-WT-3G TaxID=2725303 RepID=UPI00145DB425|nr:copper amine oxidase N-terminal domain-containing protein [Clostridium sp. SM-530-WT-3G]NME81586.1 hypothetical protein [Clostridium sp. SM-530-WT-3G]
MIRNKLHKGIPFFMALGLMMTPVVSAHAEAYGTGLTKAIVNEDVDPGFTIKPEVFVNSEQINGDDIKIINGVAAFPLEVISQKMGDILEGSNDASYVLRKSDKLIVITPSENKYKVNGVEDNCEFTVVGDKTYAPYTFFDTVMGYDMSFEGNSIIFGETNTTGNVLDGTAFDNIMINPAVYINGDKYPDFGIVIKDGQVYLPLDVICEKMGDRLEGDVSTAYYLRKDNMMLVVNIAEGKYSLNNQENNLDMTMNNGHVYVPVSFLSDVLNYNVKNDGNDVIIGTEKVQTVIDNTYPNASWINDNGTWYLMNGNDKVTGWAAYNNSWYHMNNEGKMQTGWINLNGKWYFLNEDGAMQTGWIKSNGENYYLTESGEMAVNTVVDGYTIAENGICIALY